MRIKKPIILHLPELLIRELDKYLNENPLAFKYEMINFYYIIHHLIIQSLVSKDKEYFTLNKKSFQDVTVSNISKYIKILKNGEFIISDNQFEIGKKSLGYKLAPYYLKGLQAIEINPETKLFNKLIKHHRKKKAHYNRLEPFLRQMKDEFMKVELDYVLARKWIRENVNESKKYHYFTVLGLIEDNRFRYFNRNKTNNRLDTNLTNLKSDLRQLLIGDYVNIDLKNSQLFFLSLLIKHILDMNNTNITKYLPLMLLFFENKLIKTFGNKALQRISIIHQNQKKVNMVNLSKFNNATKKGILYDDFISSYPGNVERDEVKNILFKVLFSQNEIYHKYTKFTPYEKEKKIFQTVYPFIYDIIKVLKQKNHSKLAILLQRMESYIFIDCISKELVERDIIPLTIHDSIIIKQKDQEQAIGIIKNVFLSHCGVVPTFHIKNLKKTN